MSKAALFALGLAVLVGCGAEGVTGEPSNNNPNVYTVPYEVSYGDGTKVQCHYIENYPESNWCRQPVPTPAQTPRPVR